MDERVKAYLERRNAETVRFALAWIVCIASVLMIAGMTWVRW